MPGSKLDRELERALTAAGGSSKSVPGSGAGAGAADDGAGATAASAAASPAKRGNIGLLVALLAMGGGILALVMTSFKDAAVYSKSVDQIHADSAHLMGRRLRVEGNLVHGSLVRRDQPCEYRFTIKGKEGAELPVRFPQCVVPDTFKDVPNIELGVTIEGKLASGGTSFDATQVLAKCPSKYEMKEKADKGEQMPHQLAPAM